jgi:hypothetical protein
MADSKAFILSCSFNLSLSKIDQKMMAQFNIETLSGEIIVPNVPGNTSDSEVCLLAKKADGTHAAIAMKKPGIVAIVWPDDATRMQGFPENHPNIP